MLLSFEIMATLIGVKPGLFVLDPCWHNYLVRSPLAIGYNRLLKVWSDTGAAFGHMANH